MQNNQEKRIINSCHTCRLPIYEGEPIYTSSRGESSGRAQGAYGGYGGGGGGHGGGYAGTYSGAHSSETWAQCAWCYDYWQVELAKNKSFWKKWWIGGILLAILASGASIFIWPGIDLIEGKWYRFNILTLGSLKIPVLAPIILVAIITLTGILGSLFQPAVNRYKLRKNPTKL